MMKILQALVSGAVFLFSALGIDAFLTRRFCETFGIERPGGGTILVLVTVMTAAVVAAGLEDFVK